MFVLPFIPSGILVLIWMMGQVHSYVNLKSGFIMFIARICYGTEEQSDLSGSSVVCKKKKLNPFPFAKECDYVYKYLESNCLCVVGNACAGC